ELCIRIGPAQCLDNPLGELELHGAPCIQWELVERLISQPLIGDARGGNMRIELYIADPVWIELLGRHAHIESHPVTDARQRSSVERRSRNKRPTVGRDL